MSHVPGLVNEGRRKNRVNFLAWKLLLQCPPAVLELMSEWDLRWGWGAMYGVIWPACLSYLQSSGESFIIRIFIKGLLLPGTAQRGFNSTFCICSVTPHPASDLALLNPFLNRKTWARMTFPQLKPHLFYILRNISRAFVFYLAPFLDFLG